MDLLDRCFLACRNTIMYANRTVHAHQSRSLALGQIRYRVHDLHIQLYRECTLDLFPTEADFSRRVL
jgi:hypothetical protein